MTATNKPLMSLCAADIMTRNVTLVPRKMSLQGAARMLARAGVTGAPIVDDAGHCVGVLTATDFMHSFEQEPKSCCNPDEHGSAISQPWQIPEGSQVNHICVEDYMTKDPVLVTPGTRIGELARMMVDAHIHRTIVVDPVTKNPCGIVSSMDILAVLARLHQAAPDTEDEQAFEVQAGAVH